MPGDGTSHTQGVRNLLVLASLTRLQAAVPPNSFFRPHYLASQLGIFTPLHRRCAAAGLKEGLTMLALLKILHTPIGPYTCVYMPHLGPFYFLVLFFFFLFFSLLPFLSLLRDGVANCGVRPDGYGPAGVPPMLLLPAYTGEAWNTGRNLLWVDARHGCRSACSITPPYFWMYCVFV
jgi:hypothetical protein